MWIQQTCARNSYQPSSMSIYHSLRASRGTYSLSVDIINTQQIVTS